MGGAASPIGSNLEFSVLPEDSWSRDSNLQPFNHWLTHSVAFALLKQATCSYSTFFKKRPHCFLGVLPPLFKAVRLSPDPSGWILKAKNQSNHNSLAAENCLTSDQSAESPQSHSCSQFLCVCVRVRSRTVTSRATQSGPSSTTACAAGI